MEKKIERPVITSLDIRIVISVMICYLTSMLLEMQGIKFPIGEMKLDILQKMTACITCLLVCQDNGITSKSAGINRLIITLIAGIVGILVVVIDTNVGNRWLMAGMILLGIIATLLICKACKIPYIQCRIGAVTFILVTCTMVSNFRIWYAVFRLVSTFYGVLVSLIVTYIYEKISLNYLRNDRINC